MLLQSAKFKDTKCHLCGKVGHLKSVCRSGKKAVDKPEQQSRRKNVHHVQDATETELTKEYTLFNLSFPQRPQPYTVTTYEC